MLLPTPKSLSNKYHLMLLCLMGYGLHPVNLYAADPSQRLSEFIRAEEQARQRLHGEAGQGGNTLKGRILGQLEISCAALKQQIAAEEAADRNKIPALLIERSFWPMFGEHFIWRYYVKFFILL